MGTRAAPHGLHRFTNDPVLDYYARYCGLPSGIGRLCLLDDQTLSKVIQIVGIPAHSTVLDLAGQGFLARWLLWNSLNCRYVGVQSVRETRGATPGNTPRFARIFALETARGGIVPHSLVECIAENLAADGQYAITLASFDDNHDGKISRSIVRLQKYADVVQQIDLTLQVRDFAATLYSAFLLGTWKPAFKTKVLDEAARVLHAVESGTFNYTLLTGSARAG